MEFRGVKIAIGYDPRESAVYHVLTQSILEKATIPVEIIPLHTPMLGGFDGQQDGTNAFIYSRFLVPQLMGYKGWCLYMDSDMLFRSDPSELWSLRDDSKAVMCVKHDYETTTDTKFVGTPLESPNGDYPRKNWSSLILWNCAHPKNKILTRKFVSEAGGRVLHRFNWLDDSLIGDIPKRWNHLVGEQPDDGNAANIHFTLGAPGFWYYQDTDYASEWHRHLVKVNHMAGENPKDMVKRSMKRV